MAANPLQAECEEYTLLEIARVSAENVDMPAIVKSFMARGVSRATAYRWVQHTIADTAAGRVAVPKLPSRPKTARPAPPKKMKGPTPPQRPRRPAVIDVRAIRERLDISQDRFARRFGFSVSAVRQWERGARDPEAAACVLLLLIDQNPKPVSDMVIRWESMQASRDSGAA